MALDYYQQYRENKKRRGRQKIILPKEQQTYIKEKVTQGWTPDVIIGRKEIIISCSMRTLCRQFKEKIFGEAILPMNGKRKPNGHQERRGKQAFKRNIVERETDYPAFKEEFGHIEGDTIVGAHHKSAVINFVERLSKVIITFDCGKEFSNCKALSNQHDVAIYFADPRTPSQRGLNEHSNGLLRKDGLPKAMDFNLVD